MAAAHAGAPASGNRIDLVDEHDTGRILLRLLKQIADTGCAHAHKHLHKVGTGNGEEGHARLSGHRLGKQRLARSGRSHEQQALGDSGANAGVLLGVAQEIHHFLQLFLLFLQSGHVAEIHLVVPAHPRAALAEVHHPGVGPAASGAAVHHHDNDHHHHGGEQNGKGNGQQNIFLGHVGHVVAVDPALPQQLLHFIHVRNIHLLLSAIRHIDNHLARRHLGILVDGDLRDPGMVFRQ